MRDLPNSHPARDFSNGTKTDGCRCCAIVVVLVLLQTAASVGFAQISTPQRIEVIKQLKEGKNEQALSIARVALKSAPHDCSLLSLQSIALVNLNQIQSGLGSFQKALTYCPAYLPALEGAAQIEYARHGSETIPLLRRIIALQPGNPNANAMLAMSLRAQGSCEDALGPFDASKGLFPDRPDLLQGYGSCLAETGDLDSALHQYALLLASHPSNTIRYNTALLQWKTHANAEALVTLTPLLADTGEAPALALASKIHEEIGETPEAVVLLRTAIVRSPDDVDNYLDFAAIAFAHKSFQVGIDVVDAGIKRLPNSAPLYVSRGVLEVQLSQSDVAIADFDQAHKLDPTLSFAVDAIGIMRSQQHESAESMAIFEAQVKQHPDDPLLQYLLAEKLSENVGDATDEQLKFAIDAARKAVVLDPKYKAAHDLLAVLYVRTNQPELAIQQAEMALTEDPSDQEALYQEIRARKRAGNLSQIQSLVARLEEARKENGRKQQRVDRYRLQDEINH